MNHLRAALAAVLMAAASACSDGSPSTAPNLDDVSPAPSFNLVGNGGTRRTSAHPAFPRYVLRRAREYLCEREVASNLVLSLGPIGSCVWKSTERLFRLTVKQCAWTLTVV